MMRKFFVKLWQKLTLENFTIFMAVVGQSASYIQAFKIFYLKSSYAISSLAWFLSFTSCVTWLTYGVSKRIKPAIISSLFGLGGSLLILLGIILYKVG